MKYSKINNYKVIFFHVFGWIGFHMLTLISVHARSMFNDMQYYPLDQFFNYLAGIFVFYFSSYVMLPKFENKNILNITLFFFITIIGFYFIQELRVISAIVQGVYDEIPMYFRNPFFMMLAFSRDFAVYLAFASVYWFYLVRQKDEKEKILIMEKNHQTEMNYLKSQLNQHFLYNTLNSFFNDAFPYSEKLAHDIAALAKLIRYSWSIDNKVITIKEEINFLNLYLDLQRMRFGKKLKLELNVSNELQEEKIVHMAIITLSENAFKYADYLIKPIIINIYKENNELIVYMENEISKTEQVIKSSKLGLENLKNRLTLFFPGKYKLEQENDLKTFKIKLSITQ